MKRQISKLLVLLILFPAGCSQLTGSSNFNLSSLIEPSSYQEPTTLPISAPSFSSEITQLDPIPLEEPSEVENNEEEEEVSLPIEDELEDEIQVPAEEPEQEEPEPETVEEIEEDTDLGMFFNIDKSGYGLHKTRTPSIGLVTPAIILVDFRNEQGTSLDIEMIDKAFNGAEDETMWISVKDYFAQSSFGKLNFNFEIPTSFLHLQERASYYANNTYKQRLYNEIQANTQLDFSDPKYDIDDNGALDAVIIVYKHPPKAGTDWWAEVIRPNATYTFGKKKANNLMVVSVDQCNGNIAYDANIAFPMTRYKAKGQNVDPSVYIHEVVHLLGLPDLYDKDFKAGPPGAVGGLDILEYNFNDINAWEKMLLGWVTPSWVYAKEHEFQLVSSQIEGENIIVIGKKAADMEEEYFVIQLYTPNNINKYDYYEDNFTPWYFLTSTSIIIYHIIPGKIASTGYFSNNSTNTANKLIEIVEIDNNDSIRSDDFIAINKDDLIDETDEFGEEGIKVRLSTDLSNHYNQGLDFELTVKQISNYQASIIVKVI